MGRVKDEVESIHAGMEDLVSMVGSLLSGMEKAETKLANVERACMFCLRISEPSSAPSRTELRPPRNSACGLQSSNSRFYLCVSQWLWLHLAGPYTQVNLSLRISVHPLLTSRNNSTT